MSPPPILLCHLVGSGGAPRARTLLPPSVCLMGQEPMPGLAWVALESRRLHLGPECGFWATFMGPWLGPWSVPGRGAACGDCVLVRGTAPRSSYVSRVCPRLCASSPAPRPPSTILRSSGSRNRPVLPSARLALISAHCSSGYPSPAAQLCPSRARKPALAALGGALHPVMSTERWHQQEYSHQDPQPPWELCSAGFTHTSRVRPCVQCQPQRNTAAPASPSRPLLCAQGDQASLRLQQGGVTRRTGLDSEQGPA